jgi:hypothetical protein
MSCNLERPGRSGQRRDWFSGLHCRRYSRPNANVLYELVHAHALRKASILLRSLDAYSRPPEALVGYHYIAYDPSALDDLEPDVQRAAQRFVERVASEP